MKKSKHLLVGLAALVLVGGMLVSLPVNHARADTTAQLMTLDPSSLPATLDSQTTIAGEDVVTNWTDASGDTFTVAGPAGSVLTLGTDTDGIPYAEVSPPLINTSAITGDQAIAQYAASGLSLYQDALAVGFSSADAQQLVNEDNDGRIIGQICLKTHWSGAFSHECDVQHLLQHNGSTGWYIGNRTEATAGATGDFHGLYWFRTYVTYDHHDAISWKPDATVNRGPNCANYTATASAPNNNSVSVTQDVCPSTLNPFFPPIDGFGAVWQTAALLPACSNLTEADPSASVEYDAGGAPTDNYSLWVKAKWNSLCTPI